MMNERFDPSRLVCLKLDDTGLCAPLMQDTGTSNAFSEQFIEEPREFEEAKTSLAGSTGQAAPR